MSSVVIHPQYYPPGVFYDLALLQLDASADITKNNIGLECLPDSRGESYVVDQCVGQGDIRGIQHICKTQEDPETMPFSYIVHCTVRFPWWITSHASLSSRTETRIQVKLLGTRIE